MLLLQNCQLFLHLFNDYKFCRVNVTKKKKKEIWFEVSSFITVLQFFHTTFVCIILSFLKILTVSKKISDSKTWINDVKINSLSKKNLKTSFSTKKLKSFFCYLFHCSPKRITVKMMLLLMNYYRVAILMYAICIQKTDSKQKLRWWEIK